MPSTREARVATEVPASFSSTSPAAELKARDVRIDAGEASAVLACVLQYVHERAAHLERSAQHVCVITIGEDTALALPRPVEVARDAHEQPLHPARERARVPSL